jgi:glutamate 5-kinase
LLELVHVNPETGLNEIAPEVRCTRFVADKHEVSNVKKWIAHSEDFSKGAIYLNEGAVRALLGEKAASILPVGVTRVEGSFEADDIVRILADTDGSRLGVGKVSCSSDRAQKLLGKKGQKPLVHYDYLWLE